MADHGRVEVVILDDHHIVASGIARVLQTDRRVALAGRASSLSELKTLLSRVHADVLLFDIRVPDSAGCVEIRALKQKHPQLKVVVLTGYGHAYEKEAFAYGADAFLTKDRASDVILNTILEVCFPGMPLGGPSVGLTERETEVAEGAASGLTNPEIAERLGISINTVKTHLANVMVKLDVRDRVELALRWRKEHGPTE